MKNLKRILSLALASVMVMGMMVVGASAAFNDQADIDHATAVETLVALGIISGKENGNFDPKGNLTRAEMATVIAVIRNRGIAPNFGTKATPTYSDIDNHWAESYIEYCTSFGIVGGIGGGKFDPDGTLTSTQAARMLLNAMGYTIEDPSNWALLTEVQAREEGIDLYDGIDEEIADPTNAKITRDQMAQMAYNALNGNMANAQVTTTTYYELTVTGDETIAAKLQGEVYTSAADAAAVAESHGLKPTGSVDSSGTPVTKTYSISKKTEDTTEKLGEKYLGTQKKPITVATVKYDKDAKGYKVNGTYVVANDVSNLIGHSVTVLYKTVGNSIKTYGFVDNSVVLGEGNVGELGTIAAAAKKIELDGEELNLADTADKIAVTDLNTNNSNFLNAFVATGREYNKIVAISDDGKTVARLVTTPVKFGTVGYVGNTQFTVTGVDTYTTSKVDVYEGMKKNDQVLVTPAANTSDNKAKIEKAPVTEGAKVDATKGTNQVRVNGTWYTANTTAIFDGLKALGEFDVVILNGYVVAQKAAGDSAAAAGVGDVIMVTALGDFSAASDFKGTPALYPARIITATGEVTELNVVGIWDTTDEEYKAVGKETSDPKPVKNTLYTAAKDKDGNYNLTAVEGDDQDKWNKMDEVDLSTNKIEKGQVTIGGTKYRFDNDAVVFVYSSGKFKAAVIKGSEVNTWGETTPTGGTIYSAEKNGFPYVSMAVIDLGADDTLPGQAAVAGLGWITGDAAYTKVNDKGALEMEIFDGETTRTVTVTSLDNGSITTDTAATYTKGVFVTFEESADNTIDKLAVASDLVAKAITAFDGGETFVLSGVAGEQKLETDKWTVMYINTKDGKGVEGGTIQIAGKSDLGDFIENVYADAAKNILVVDVNNVLDELAKEVTFTPDGTVITAFNDARTEVTVAATKTGNDVIGVAKVLEGAKNAKVIDANGEAVTTNAVDNGNILQITTESGRMYNLTIKIAQ